MDENVVTLLYLADRRHLALKGSNCVRFQSAGSVSVAKIRPTSTYISRGTCSKHNTVENGMVMYLAKICTACVQLCMIDSIAVSVFVFILVETSRLV